MKKEQYRRATNYLPKYSRTDRRRARHLVVHSPLHVAMSDSTGWSYHEATTVVHPILLRSFGNNHGTPAPAVLDDFGAHPSQYVLSSTVEKSARFSNLDLHLRIVLWYRDLDSKGPYSEVFQVLVHRYSGAVEGYCRQDFVEIAMSAWSYAVQQTVQNLKERELRRSLSDQVARKDARCINGFRPCLQ